MILGRQKILLTYTGDDQVNLGTGTDIICERQSCIYNSFTTCSRGTVRIGSTCLDYVQGEFTGEIIEVEEESDELVYPEGIED